MSGAVPERQTSALGPSTNPTPVDELVERLRRSVTDTTAFCPKPVYRNPDGPEAADTITTLKGEIERRDAALLNDIAVMMSEFVENWPQPKKVSTALALIAKTMREALDDA